VSSEVGGREHVLGEATRAQSERRRSVGAARAVGGVERGAAACEHREMLAEVWGSCCSRSTSTGRRAQQCSEWARRRCGARGQGQRQRQRAMDGLRRGRRAVCSRRWCCRVLWSRWATLEHLCRSSGPPSLPQTSPTGAPSVSERRRLDGRACTTDCFCNAYYSPQSPHIAILK
jgi:hypothetical protein